MRIEATTADKMRISGDIYIESSNTDEQGTVESRFPDSRLSIRQHWYPQFPPTKYSWYFRSQGAQYSRGQLMFDLDRHIWDPRSDDFTQMDVGTMSLSCQRNQITEPKLSVPTVQMTGEATFGGRSFSVTATKTAPYYRGCHVKADVMTHRQWSGDAQFRGRNITFSGVYRDAGVEFRMTLDGIDIPEDASLSTTELNQLLATHRTQSDSRPWQLWLLICSQYGTSGTLGIMFDDASPFREGASAFYDPRLSNSELIESTAQGKKIGEVPLAILRTALHEIGHALNLYHPKHDCHSVPTGTTIMNQTGDIMGFASAATPYPGNATFAFHDHNTTSLIHSPDPQIRPGWTRFGYGHGCIGNTPSEPHDLIFDRDVPRAHHIKLELDVPEEMYLGEFVLAAVRIHNTGDETRLVSTALNLEEDYLTVSLTPPEGSPVDVRSVILLCSDRQMAELEPGEYRSGYIQLMYTNREYTFAQTGRYTIQAELDLGDRIVKSDPVDMLVRSPLSEDKLEVSTKGLDTDVGRSIALGVPPIDTPAEEKLTTLAEDYPETDLGTAAAVVIANDRQQETVDYRTDDVLREADDDMTTAYLDRALEGYDATDVSEFRLRSFQ